MSAYLASVQGFGFAEAVDVVVATVGPVVGLLVFPEAAAEGTGFLAEVAHHQDGEEGGII